MSDLFTLLNSALVTALKASANLATLVGSGTDARIYDELAPDGATENYLIFQLVAGGDTNTSPRRDVDVVYRVEFISKTLATARQAAGYVDDALNNQELSVAGWSNYRMEAERLFSRVELDQGIQYFRRGAFYRISLDKTG